MQISTRKNLDEIPRLVYIMEARNHNYNLWNKKVNNCDNGAIIIRSIIMQPYPMSVQSYTRNEITILQSYIPDIIINTT